MNYEQFELVKPELTSSVVSILDAGRRMHLMKRIARDLLEVDINKDVLTGIASIALEGVQGVVPVAPAMQIGEFFSGKRLKGIGVTRDAQSVTVDLVVNIDYGRVIPDVAKEVQRAVTENIEVMTGLTVHAVNVTVQGVVVAAVSHA